MKQRVVLQSTSHEFEVEIGARYTVEPNHIVAARVQCGMSQVKFAEALQISTRTLQQWEQGRRYPSGAAETLLKIAYRHPEVLKEAQLFTSKEI